ncbi:MAG: carotenoid oxygenase family protein [Pseudomonadota bacterium]|nr:MAG: dioxygenase [Pseudomonadota bacterium]
MSVEKSANRPETGEKSTHIDRRSFVSGAIGAAAGAGALGLAAARAAAQNEPHYAEATLSVLQQQVSGPPAPEAAEASRRPRLFRLECDIADCEVEGRLPEDLQGVFYRVGPDPQYPLAPGNIPFDGEGHVSMFRFENGHVSFRSRFVRNERYLAQAKAHRILFPMYRNPHLDDPSVKGLTRGTANTHVIYFNKRLLALKEDSPPVAMDPFTLDTIDPVYTFDGQLESQTFTAHPKVCSETGNLIAFGYEAKGFGTDDVNVFEYTPDGKLVWSAWIKVPYVGLLHDFAVTQRHVVFYVIPLAIDHEQMKRGGIHWSWDGTKPTYFGFMRRGGDGRDIRWIKGPTRSSTHVMGTFDDGKKLYVDVEMSEFNPFPFMPFRDGTQWDPVRGASRITRLSVDLSRKSIRDYGIEVLYPDHIGALPRQDDRYNTVPYRYGFLPCPDPEPKDPGKRPSACYARFDHQTRRTQLYRAEPGTTLAEACFAPKSANAPEGVGYLLGVATRHNEGGRADLLVFDAEHIDEGPIATVMLPTRIVGQIHGWWAPKYQMQSA